MSDEVTRMVERKRRLKSANTEAEKEEHKGQTEIKTFCKWEKKIYPNNLCNEVENANRKGKQKELYNKSNYYQETSNSYIA